MSRTWSSPNKNLDLCMAPTHHARLRQTNECIEMRHCIQTSKSATLIAMYPQDATNRASQVFNHAQLNTPQYAASHSNTASSVAHNSRIEEACNSQWQCIVPQTNDHHGKQIGDGTVGRKRRTRHEQRCPSFSADVAAAGPAHRSCKQIGVSHQASRAGA